MLLLPWMIVYMIHTLFSYIIGPAILFGAVIAVSEMRCVHKWERSKTFSFEGMKKDTFVIGNKGYKIWIEKLVDPKAMNFKSRYACTISSSINDQKIPSDYSLKDAVVSIIPGINFQRCQNKIPLSFGASNLTKPVTKTKDLYCNF